MHFLNNVKVDCGRTRQLGTPLINSWWSWAAFSRMSSALTIALDIPPGSHEMNTQKSHSIYLLSPFIIRKKLHFIVDDNLI